MPRSTQSIDPTNSPRPQLAWLLAIAIVLIVAVSSGCSQLRIPAIDPTGRCLFAPRPTSTTLALPGMGGENCFCGRCANGLKGCLSKTKAKLHCAKEKLHGCIPSKFPEPAFPQPGAPPKCPTPGKGICKGKEGACVPSEPCAGSCKDGPPAVLFGNECKLSPKCKLPNKGKRGCILLSPQKIVAPVGGEVVLMSGICGTDGYLQMNERLEWMLTPESVGTFIQVGDDNPGLLTKLVGSRNRPEKHDPSYALGLTSTKCMLITRGNKDPRDDVQLEKGQTWITISSPTEGTSRVTVLAPDSECWDQRKATATIYWIDARWQFPGPQVVAAGQPVALTTRVTRSEGTIPARGWKVRYEILQPELATFAGTNGSSVLESTVDASGNAVAQLLPNPNTSGTATIDMRVIRPMGESENMPAIPLGRGQTYVRWSSPQLVLRTGAPPVASFNTPFEVVVNVSNPGDQAATNVRVDVPIPRNVQVVNSDEFAQRVPDGVIWEFDAIPAQTQLDLFLTLAAPASIQLPFQATADGLRTEETVRVDIFQPSLALQVSPTQDRYQAGQPATFNIDVKNIGDRPLQNVVLTATGDEGMVHQDGGRAKEKQRDGNAPLNPGQTWQVSVVFVPTQSGQRCINVQSTAAGGQVVTEQSCVTVANPIPPTQSISVTLNQNAGRTGIAVGETVLMTAQVRNTGELIQRNIQVSMVNDPQLQLGEATEDYRTQASGNLVNWIIPALAPNQSVTLEGRFRAVAANPRARIGLSAQSGEGTRANAEYFVTLADTPPTAPPIAPPELPPLSPSPNIPGGPGTPPPAPLRGTPTAPTAPPLPARSDRLQVRLFGRDNPVAVNQEIRYSLNIVNDSDQRDGQVLIQFRLPQGVDVLRIVPVTNPALGGEFQNNAGVISLAPIRSMNPGESVDYVIVLRSNQPQTFDVDLLIRSLRMTEGVSARVQTDVR